MKLSKIFKLPIYHTVVDMKVVSNVRETSNIIYRKNKFDGDDKKEYRGLSFNFDIDRFYLLFDISCITHGLLAHEIDHVVTEICKINSVIDSEARAFLAEFIHTQVYNFLKLKNIEIA